MTNSCLLAMAAGRGLLPRELLGATEKCWRLCPRPRGGAIGGHFTFAGEPEPAWFCKGYRLCFLPVLPAHLKLDCSPEASPPIPRCCLRAVGEYSCGLTIIELLRNLSCRFLIAMVWPRRPAGPFLPPVLGGTGRFEPSRGGMLFMIVSCTD